jgi:hypothetical protein
LLKRDIYIDLYGAEHDDDHLEVKMRRRRRRRMKMKKGGDRERFKGDIERLRELGHNQIGFQSPTKAIELAKNKQTAVLNLEGSFKVRLALWGFQRERRKMWG